MEEMALSELGGRFVFFRTGLELRICLEMELGWGQNGKCSNNVGPL